MTDETTIVSPTPPAHAREEWGLATPTRESDARVAEIIELMVTQRWETSMAHALAAKWGMHVDTVLRYSSEAGRHLRLIRDPKAVADYANVRLRALVDDDERDEEMRPVVPAAAKVAAIKVLVDVSAATNPGGAYTAELATGETPLDHLRRCLRAPDDDLRAALLAERDAVMAVLEGRG